MGRGVRARFTQIPATAYHSAGRVQYHGAYRDIGGVGGDKGARFSQCLLHGWLEAGEVTGHRPTNLSKRADG
jgi:hypothetical protein